MTKPDYTPLELEVKVFNINKSKGSEVLSHDTDIAVQRQESLMIGMQQGIQQGMQQGFFNGAYQAKLETAKNLLQIGLSIENISKATGLSKAELAAIK